MSKTKVIVKSNGSIRIEGDFELFDVDGNQHDLEGKTAVALCRCTNSAKMPFCDGAHKNCDFKSTFTAGPQQA